MREILFRGKRLDNGEWVEGYFANETCDGPFGPMYEQANIIIKGSGWWVPVDPATVVQFTGLKDRTGKRIFEGDIVRGPHIGDDFMVEPVEFSAVCGWMPFDYLREDLSDVIGNIHDNPELLENRWEVDKHDQS